MTPEPAKHQPPQHPPAGVRGHAPIHTSIRPILVFAVILFIVGLVVHTLIAGLYFGLTHHNAAQSKPGYFVGQRPQRTGPQLQVDPTSELQEMRQHEREVLDSYGWVDRHRGVVRIPITAAMAAYLKQQQAQTAPGGLP